MQGEHTIADLAQRREAIAGAVSALAGLDAHLYQAQGSELGPLGSVGGQQERAHPAAGDGPVLGGGLDQGAQHGLPGELAEDRAEPVVLGHDGRGGPHRQDPRPTTSMAKASSGTDLTRGSYDTLLAQRQSRRRA